MSYQRTQLAEEIERQRTALEQTNGAREMALRECRAVIRTASLSIRAIHRQEFAEARRLIDQAKSLTESVRTALASHPEVYQAGYVHDSQKELVEAEAMFALVQDLPVPRAESLGVEPPAYLNGIAEAGSEARRYVLDRLRTGDADSAAKVFDLMEQIYDELVTVDFPDAITGNLRRTTDAFRAVLERTRGDLTLTIQQRALEAAVAGARSALADELRG